MDIYRWLRRQWDRAGAVVAVVVGIVAVLLGWLGVSSSSLATEQIPYLASGAVFGLFALGVGATLWLSADLRDEWRKLDAMHETMLDIADAVRPDAATGPAPILDAVTEPPPETASGNGSERKVRARRSR